MGLAPYGEPRYADLIFDNLIVDAEHGSIQLDMIYFSYETGLTKTNNKFNAFKHEGFWHPMDTLRDHTNLEKLWNNNQALWKIW